MIKITNFYGRILLNVGSNWAHLLTTMIISLMMMPFLLRHLGPDHYGIWLIVMAIASYLIMLDIGIYSSIRRYVSFYASHNKTEEVNEILSAIFIIYFFVALVCLLVVIIIYLFLSAKFKIPSSDLTLFRQTIFIVGIGAALRFPLGIFQGALNALQRFDLSNLIMIISEVIKATLIFFFLHMDMAYYS